MRLLSLAVRIVLSAALLLLVFRGADWRTLGALLHHIAVGPALAGFAAVGLLIPLLALRLSLFLRRAGLPVSQRESIWLTWAGQFFNSVLPGSIGGDAVKLLALRRVFPGSGAAAAGAIVGDRLTALASLGPLALWGLGAGVMPALGTLGLRARIGWVVGGLVIAVAAALAWALRALWSAQWARLRAAIAAVLRPDRGLALGFVLAVAAHLAAAGAFLLFARSLGLAVPAVQAFQAVPVMTVVLLLPVTVNGHGLREFLLTLFLGHLGTSSVLQPEASANDAALALSLLLVVTDLLWSAPGG